MDFEPENALERALQDALKNPAARPEFYRQMLECDLFVLGTSSRKAEGSGNFTALPGDNMQIASIPFNGKTSIPIFSAQGRLQAYIREKRDFLVMNGRALFEMTKGASFILNPGFYGKEFLPDEIARMLDPSAPKTVVLDKPAKILIGQPAGYPHELVNALKSAFEARADVLSAYLIQIAFEGKSENPHPLIGVEITGDWKPVSAEIGRIAASVAPGALIDAVAIDRANNDTLTASLLKTEPFYVRTKH